MVPVAELPTLLPTDAAPPAPPEPIGDGWQGSDGVEARRLELTVPSSGATAPVLVLRLNLSQTRMRVGYRPGQPQPLDAWLAEPNALAVINGGFFTPEFSALGLTVSGGNAQGESLEQGGMLSVDPGGTLTIRSLADAPYSGEELAEALQSFPMLVRPGGEAGQIQENGEHNRRSAVALDADGRLLLIAAPTPAWTLQDLADALAASDLRVDVALNLDGGSSTGMAVRSGTLDAQVPAFGPLPQVIIIEPR